MTVYCTTCGGLPHGDGEELAGPPGHLATWGRLDLPTPMYRHPEEPPTPPDGPAGAREAMPAGAPKNALWLLKVPTKKTRVVESWGVWKGTEIHMLGVAGICADGVRFLSQWRLMDSGWKSEAHWIKSPGHSGPAKWSDVKEVLGERVAGK